MLSSLVILFLTSRVIVNISFKYFVPSELADSARFVKDANTAKNVAFKWLGAFFAIQASRGIIDICPRGDSKAVFTIAINFASTKPFVIEAVQLWSP